MHWWLQPAAGDFVWCRFPEDLDLIPGSKPRPALILTDGGSTVFSAKQSPQVKDAETGNLRYDRRKSLWDNASALSGGRVHHIPRHSLQRRAGCAALTGTGFRVRGLEHYGSNSCTH